MDTIGYLRSLAALGFVLGLIALLGWLARRYRLGGTPAKAARRLALVETLPIDPRRKLVLARLDGREFLLLLGQDGNRVLAAADGVAARSPATRPEDP